MWIIFGVAWAGLCLGLVRHRWLGLSGLLQSDRSDWPSALLVAGVHGWMLLLLAVNTLSGSFGVMLALLGFSLHLSVMMGVLRTISQMRATNQASPE